MTAELFRPEIGVFNDSLARCLRTQRLFQRFLELFLASSEEVREKFRNTDFNRQRRMLQNSFYMLVEYVGLSTPDSQAYRLLANPRHQRRSIAEIADQCGFGDPAYFCRRFRRAYGAPPSALRAAAVQRDGEDENRPIA